jgi:hypothetical protein
MKNLGLLAAVALFAVSCNTKPGGNHGVLPVEHEAYTADDVHHRSEHLGHEEHTEEAKHEEVKTDSVQVETVKEDTIKAGN